MSLGAQPVKETSDSSKGQRVLAGMYNPSIFREERLDVLQGVIRDHALGTLVTADENGIVANLIPFSLNAKGSGKGVLRAHMAKGNRQVAALRKGAEALIIFHGPQSYITPSWFPTKAEHGKAVPTWNYVVVQARGKPAVTENPKWLLEQFNSISSQHEEGRAHPWKVSDAPESYIAEQMQAVVGVEIPIERIEGKWKVNQDRSKEDQQGVIMGLQKEDDEAKAMAKMVEEYGKK